jgi:murein DD-endopeptidase MepM/ murein hydrolase activator NlpD
LIRPRTQNPLFFLAACLFAAGCLLLPAVGHSQAKSTAPSKTKAAQAKLKTVAGKAKEKRQEIREVRTERAEVREELEWVNSRIRRINARIKETQLRIESRRAEQRKAGKALTRAGELLEQVRQIVRTRIRSMYVQGDQPRILTLLGAEDAASFASRKALLERIAQRDKALFKEMKVRQAQVAQRKRTVDRLVTEVLSLEDQQRKEQAGLMEAQDDREAIIKGLNQEEDRLEEELDELEKESNRLTDEIEKYQRSMRAGSTGYVMPWRGGLVRPARGRLSSGFGYRIHPISRRRKMHTGIDIAAPTGTPIVAAAPGVVISAGTMRGYGGTVILDHGGGFSTLYAHCSRLLVRRGQRVKAGERIALMGSTGYSTGPHLHFETRVNGRPVNPLSRL